MSTRKLTSALLAGLLLLPMTACGGGTASDTAVTTAATAETTPVETAPLHADDLPDTLNYDGGKVTFLYREEIADEFYTSELNGELINDTIHNDFIEVENRLNVKLNVITEPGDVASLRAGYMAMVANSVIAGDTTYDWVDMLIGLAPGQVTQGVYRNIANTPNMDFSKPYYIPNIVDTVGIDGKLYFTAGDASISYLTYAFCMYYNRTVAESFGVEDLYKVVHEGKWTVDKLREVAEQCSVDVDGDGVYTLGTDKFGFIESENNSRRGFMAATEFTMYERNKDGEWEFVLDNDHDQRAVQKVYELFNETTGTILSTAADKSNPTRVLQDKAQFSAGNVTVVTAQLFDVINNYREMEDTLGLLPYPKLDEAQTDYHVSSRNTHNSFSMTLTCSDPARAGAVMECLASENYTNLLPAYFEVALKTKYAADNETAQMYDLIHEHMVLDFGYTYNDNIGSPMNKIWVPSIQKDASQYSSLLASYTETVKTTLADYVAGVKALAE